MRKGTEAGLLAGLMLLLLTSCGPKQPSEITITAGETTLHWEVGMNQWDGAVYDRMDNCTMILSSGTEAVEVSPGTILKVTFSNHAPDALSVSGQGLTQAEEAPADGAWIHPADDLWYDHSGEGWPETEISGSDGIYTFPLPEGEGLTVITIRCGWGEDQCDYVCMVTLTEDA